MLHGGQDHDAVVLLERAAPSAMMLAEPVAEDERDEIFEPRPGASKLKFPPCCCSSV